MGFLQQETDTVDLGAGYWATVRALTAGEYGDVEKVLAGTKVSGKGDVDITPDLAEFRRRLVTASLVEWNLTDEQDVLLPLPPVPPETERPQVRATAVRARRTSVDRLPMWAFEQIRTAADKLNGSRDKREVAQFPDGDLGGDTDAEAGAAGAAEVPDGAAVVAAAGPAPGGSGAHSLPA